MSGDGSAPTQRVVLVAGAAGALGLRAARALVDRGDAVIAAYRRERPEALAALERLGCTLLQLDLTDVDRAADEIAKADAAVLTPILTVSGPAARAALNRKADRPVGRLVLFSSNNVAIDGESPVYAALRAEEAAVAASPGDWTLIRPTMIYGHPADGSLSRLIRMARRLPLLPLPGAGRALQQPIHVDDLADFSAHVIHTAERSSVVTVAGPDALTLRALYEAAAAAAGGGPVVSLPLGPLRLFAGAAERIGAPFPLDAKQLARIDLDKTPRGAAPMDWRPKVSLAEGLGRLAAELKAGPSA